MHLLANKEEECVVQPQQFLLRKAAMELESIRRDDRDHHHQHHHGLHPIPPACLELIWKIPGNRSCVDCGASGPSWATVSYGSLVCLQCSGEHRSLGVRTSCVRSITMDHWSHSQILAMLEGGNKQLRDFFERHELPPAFVSTPEGNAVMRYKTKAARFYREHMSLHVSKVLGSGTYQGREASRQYHQIPSSCSHSEVTTTS